MTWLNSQDSRAAHDGGFTLIELIVVVAILPLVVAAISVALLSVFSNESSTTNSLTSSGDAQVSSATFVPDVQSASWITQDPSIECAPSSGSSVPIISFSDDNVANTVASPITDIVSYDETPNPGMNTVSLVREACMSGNDVCTPTPSFPCSTVVSHNALTTSTLTISPLLSGLGTGWVSASSATNINLVVNEPATSHASASPTDIQSYSLNAVPRTTVNDGAAPSGTSPILPLQFVGECPAAALRFNGHGLTVEGGNGLVGTSQTGCAQYPNLSSAYPYVGGVGNPFMNLNPPTTPATSGPAGSCSSTTMICTSGWYTTGTPGFTASMPSGYTFDPSTGPHPGVIVFEVPLTVTGDTFNGSSNLSNFTYSFEQGLSISGSSNFGSATYIFSTSTSGANLLSVANHTTITASANAGSGGVLFYMSGTAAGTATVTNGTVTVGNGFSGTFYSPPSGPYDGIVWWDASCGAWGAGQGNGGGSGPDFNGGIYAPCAPIDLGGGIQYQAEFIVLGGSLSTNGSTGTITG